MLLLSAIALALAGRPVVEQLDPPADAVDVDPDRTTISVRFDQPMSQDSWSWTGAPPLFPKATDKPRFDDRRTATMPVALEPGTLYMLGVNSAQHTGFRSKANEPAVPVLWRFVTAGEALPQEVHDASLEQAEAALTLRYSHQGRKSVDWSEALAFMREGALSRPAFALALAHALGAAEDMHLTVVVDGVRLGTHEQTIEPNVDGRLLDARLSERLDGATYAGVNDGIGTLVITSWTVEQRDVSAVDRWLDAHCDQPLIVDVRLNSGGDEVLARQIAGRFTEERVVYAKQRVRRSDGSFGEVGSRWLEPRGTRCTGPVVVLTGPACASSNEAFLLMMRASGAKLVGERSRGSSGNPRPVELDNGVVLYVPTWQALDADGKPLEGIGIAPDVEVPWGGGDPVYDRALELLRAIGE